MKKTGFRSRVFLFILMAFLIGAFASAGIAQEEEGLLEGDNWYGTYDNETGFEDDWYYDRYDQYDQGIMEDEWYGVGPEWTEDDEFFSGGWEDEGAADDDWFYDYYDDPGDEGLFDI